MGLNNYVTVIDIQPDGSAIELDIAFSYGEVREYFYRVGDEVFVTEQENSDNGGMYVIPGLAALSGNNKNEMVHERYYRIIISNGRITAYFPTTQGDYEDLEAQRRQLER